MRRLSVRAAIALSASIYIAAGCCARASSASDLYDLLPSGKVKTCSYSDSFDTLILRVEAEKTEGTLKMWLEPSVLFLDLHHRNIADRIAIIVDDVGIASAGNSPSLQAKYRSLTKLALAACFGRGA